MGTHPIDHRSPAEATVRWRAASIPAALVAVAVLIAYLAVTRAGFVWDDDSHLTANPCIIGPLGLKEIWTTASANYFPLVLTNFWVQHALWGLNPVPYHVINVVFHAISAVLLGLLLTRLNVRGAWLGTALWALHPVQVESVAWISELKNTQSGVFYLLAVHCYLRWLESPTPRGRRRHYALLLLCALAALLSKPSTVMLPVALLLCRWWREGRFAWRHLKSVLPLFALSAAAAAWTVWEQKFHSFALGAAWNQSLAERVAIAGKCVWFYLGKLLWPDSLAFIYPRFTIGAGWPDLLPALAALAALGTLWWSRAKCARGVFFAFAYFIALLFPVLGFFNVYFFRYSFVADHFQYLASMAPLALLGAAIITLSEHLGETAARILRVGAAVVLAALGGLTAAQTHTFRNARTLWETTQARNPQCWLADTILGNIANEENRHQEALRLHQHALELNPDAFEAHYNLGLALVKLGRPEDALPEYRRALQLKPDFAEAEHNLGVALAAADRPGEAIAHYERALRLHPRQAESHCMLGLALTLTDRAAEAIPHYERAVELKPDYPEAEYALARTLEMMNRPADAITHYRNAVRLSPAYGDAHAHLAAALFRVGQRAAAIDEFAAAAKLQPQNADLRSDLASALLARGDVAAAISEYEAALHIDPQLAAAHYNLAIALRASGRPAESAMHYREARRLKPDLPPLPTQ